MSFSEPLTQELNDELQQKVADGDENARQSMIEGNMRLAAAKVERFIAIRPRFEQLKDDLLSEAFVGLTKGVNLIRDRGVVENPTGLLSVSIENQLRSTAAKSDVVRSHRHSRHPDESPTVLYGLTDSLTYEPDAVNELREEIYACCENDIEREIVMGREDGLSDTEIADAVGLDRRRVGEIRCEIEKRFTRR